MKNIFFFVVLIFSIFKIYAQNDIDYIGKVYVDEISIPYVEISYFNKITNKNTSVLTNRFGEFFLDKTTLDESSQIYLKPPFPLNSRKIQFTYRQLREEYHVDITFDTYKESEFRKNIKKVFKKYRDDSKFKNGEVKFKDYVALEKYLSLQYLSYFPNGRESKNYRKKLQADIYNFLSEQNNYNFNKKYLKVFGDGPNHQKIISQTELMLVSKSKTKAALKKYLLAYPNGVHRLTALLKFSSLQDNIPQKALRNVRELENLTNDKNNFDQVKNAVLPKYLLKSRTYLNFKALIFAFPNQIQRIEDYYLLHENLDNKLKAYENYIAVFKGKGSLISERKAYIETAKKDFELARKENSIVAYEKYQKKYKQGEYFKIANDSITKLKSYEKEQENVRMRLAENYINTLEPSAYQKKLDSLLNREQKAVIYKKVAKKQESELINALREKDLERVDKIWVDINENINRSGYAQFFTFKLGYRSSYVNLRAKERRKLEKEERITFQKSVKYNLATNIYYNTKYVPETYKVEFDEHFNLFGDNTYEPVIRKNTNSYDERTHYVVVVKIKNTSKVAHKFRVRTYGEVEQAVSVNAAKGVNKLAAIFANGAREASGLNDVFESKSKTILLKPNETQNITFKGKCEGVKSAKVSVTPLRL